MVISVIQYLHAALKQNGTALYRHWTMRFRQVSVHNSTDVCVKQGHVINQKFHEITNLINI